MCPQERLVIISTTTGLSFAIKRIGPLAAIIITVFYLLVLYLSAISKTPKNLSASIYSEFHIKTACQHVLLLVGFDTLIYRKFYDAPPILVGHQRHRWRPEGPTPRGGATEGGAAPWHGVAASSAPFVPPSDSVYVTEK